MSASNGTAQTAFQVADRVRSQLSEPWDVFGERARRFEIHWNGLHVEMVRGPVQIEGVGIRVARPAGTELGIGFSATADLSDPGIDAAAQSAETAARFARFPAKSLVLPENGGPHPSVEIRDTRLWDRPMETLQSYVSDLRQAFDGRSALVPSFGSIRATLLEATLANSAGFSKGYAHTLVELELAVKAFGGPEGAPPGEFWVNDSGRRVTLGGLRESVDRWGRLAEDARHAKPTPSGSLNVILPPDVLSEIIPRVLEYRMSGAAQLRQMTPPAGSRLGSDHVTIVDDGQLPWGLSTGPFDDEGTVQGRVLLVKSGIAQEPLYDALHGAAFERGSTGNARRSPPFGDAWFHFTRSPSISATTLVMTPGEGGSLEEIAEVAGEGILIGQLAWAFPDPVSAAFGGELRIGYRIRNGKVAEAIRGGTVGGVVLAPEGEPSLLQSLDAIGSRPELHGDLSAPYCLARGLTVAGPD